MIIDFLHRLWYTLFRDKDLKPRSGAADTDTEEQKEKRVWNSRVPRPRKTCGKPLQARARHATSTPTLPAWPRRKAMSSWLPSLRRPPATRRSMPRSGSNCCAAVPSPTRSPAWTWPPAASTTSGPRCTPAWPRRPRKRASTRSQPCSPWWHRSRRSTRSATAPWPRT